MVSSKPQVGSRHCPEHRRKQRILLALSLGAKLGSPNSVLVDNRHLVGRNTPRRCRYISLGNISGIGQGTYPDTITVCRRPRASPANGPRAGGRTYVTARVLMRGGPSGAKTWNGIVISQEIRVCLRRPEDLQQAGVDQVYAVAKVYWAMRELECSHSSTSPSAGVDLDSGQYQYSK